MVSANDVNQMDEISTTDSDTISIDGINTNNMISVSDSNNIDDNNLSSSNIVTSDSLSSDNNIQSFSDLYNEINGNSNTVINLTKDYKYNSSKDSSYSDGIQVNRIITINGGGHVIDGGNLANSIFIFNNNVNLNNVTFSHFRETAVSIVYNTQSNINNCSFIENTRGLQFGSYQTSPTGSANVCNCSFIGNTGDSVSTGEGASILSYIQLSVDNCEFINNTVVSSVNGGKAGSIMIWGTSSGYATGTCYVKNSIFINNSGKDYMLMVQSSPTQFINNAFIGLTSSLKISAPSTASFTYNWWGSNNPSVYSGSILKAQINFISLTNDNATFNVNFVDGSNNPVDVSWTRPVTYTIANDNFIISNITDSKSSIGWVGHGVFRDSNVTVDNQVLHGNSFSDLQLLINKATSSSTVNLNYDYHYYADTDSAISINKILTINGNGHKLDGCKKARIMDTTSGITATFNNLSFVNGYGNEGTAIYIRGNSYFYNCHFENCTGTNNGGAICAWQYTTYNLVVQNCSFVNNRASNTGDDIWTSFNLQFSYNSLIPTRADCIRVESANGQFNYNWWGSNNPSIYKGSTLLKIRLEFINLTNEEIAFKVIFVDNSNNPVNVGWSRPVTYTLSNDNFIINNISDTKSIIEWQNNIDFMDFMVTVDNQVLYVNSFSELQSIINKATSNVDLYFNYRYYTECDSGYTAGMTITKTLTLNGNNHTLDAKTKSRIFRISGNNVVVSNLTFINGYGSTDITIDGKYNYKDAGAISASGSGLILINCVFDSCQGLQHYGAVEILGANCRVSYCNFTNNKALTYDGALGFMGSSANNGVVEYCNFINNTAARWAAGIRADRQITINYCNFINNKGTTLGGAIFLNNIYPAYINNCTFKDNSAQQGGGIYSQYTLVVDGCNFTNCKSTLNSDDYSGGGAILHINSGSFTLNNCNFVDDTSAKRGGAISNTAGTLTVTNCNFTNCHSVNGGGDIANIGSTLTITNVNSEGSYGRGTIWSTASITISGSNFSNFINIDEQIGAIYIENKVTVSDSSFYNNTGDIYSGSNGVVATNCNFTKTHIVSSITYKSSTLQVTNCKFEECTSTTEGGAIFTNSATGLTIKGSSFNKCTSGSGYIGGAVVFNIGSNAVTISNSNFTNCAAHREGGAIYIYASSLSVSNSRFINNTNDPSSSTRGGGAIFVHAATTVTNSMFIDNYCSSKGGAVSIVDYRATISSSSFINNRAFDGGAIYLQYNGADISSCVFRDNHATQLGGVLRKDNTNSLTVKDSIILNNTAGYEYSDHHIFSTTGSQTTMTLNYNWWGHNSTNKNNLVPVLPRSPAGATLTYWLYLESTSPTEFDLVYNNKSIDILYNLNHYATSSASGSYDAKNLLSIVLNVFATKGEILNVSKIQNGQFTAKYNVSEYSRDAKVIVEDYKHIIGFNVYPEDSFYALQTIIDKNTNGTVDLSRDYHYYTDYDNSPVIISKDLILNGNGHVINGSGASRIFTISGSDVTLRDIVFDNAKSSSTGGAIYHYNGVLRISGSTFSNNIVTGDGGGAIYHSGGSLSIIGSKFINNIAAGLNGGAIYSATSISSLTSCDFTSNSANNGGAIYTTADISGFENNNFMSNIATGYGGAIYQYYNNTMAIVSSTFVGNEATLGGGAISTKGGTNIQRSTFIKNYAGKGAVIYNVGGGESSVTNSIIINNNGASTPAENLFYRTSNGTFALNYNWWGNNASNKNSITSVIGDVPTGATLDYWLYVDSESNVTEYDVFTLGQSASVKFNLNHFATTSTDGSYDASRLPVIGFDVTGRGGNVSRNNVTLSGTTEEIIFTFVESSDVARVILSYENIFSFSHIFKLNTYNVTVSVDPNVLPVTSEYGTPITINGYINYPDGALMPKGSVYLTLCNKTYCAVVDSNGNFTMVISDALPGYYYTVNDVYFKEADDEV